MLFEFCITRPHRAKIKELEAELADVDSLLHLSASQPNPHQQRIQAIEQLNVIRAQFLTKSDDDPAIGQAAIDQLRETFIPLSRWAT